jgi:hypothetical protein
VPEWRRLDDEGAGYLYSLSDALSVTEWRYPGLLNPVSHGTMVIASDYSGQHKGARHEAYSFIITTVPGMHEWKEHLRDHRATWLPDGRRMSFKQLKDKVRQRALAPFLNAADLIHGNLITCLIDVRIGSFLGGGPTAVREIFSDCFDEHTAPGTIEKMLRLASLLSLLITGLRREDQPSLWVSDHDETLATHDRREQFARLAAYLSLGLSKWRQPADQFFTTTESPNCPEWGEDLAAIADIVAGSYCELADVLPAWTGASSWIRVVSSDAADDWRARAIGNWLAHRAGTLRKVLLRLELDEHGVVHASAQSAVKRL